MKDLTDMTYTERQAAIKTLADTFPATFGLRGWPETTFRISLSASHVAFGAIQLYTQGLFDGKWLDHAKGTEAELRRAIIADPNA